jgi:PTS system mannitol-specific IIC component
VANLDINILRVKFQNFGNFLSGMFVPNIGVFIAWGFLTALFIPSGWFPNEKLASISKPMLLFLLPTLVGYTGGKLVYDTRGAVVGVVATFGMIVGSSIPMFLGAMIAGPLGAYLIKKFDKKVRYWVKPGFEMFVSNFSAGIIGLMLAIFFFLIVGPTVERLNTVLEIGVNFLVEWRLLPLTSILVEPAKVLFLNNAINHGVFSPLGMLQVSKFGKSIFFLIETNPGPGLGVLLAFLLFGKKTEKEASSGAIIIHLFGGIHEIYFPYILMKPILILALIAGGMTGVMTYVLLDVGLVAPPSPGSIFSLIAMSPKNSIFVVLVGFVFSTVVSCLVASLLLKSAEEIKESEIKVEKQRLMNKKTAICRGKIISKIAVACDAGFGTSAMGAAILRKKNK